MLKKSFLGLSNLRIEYELLPVKVAVPEKVTASKTVTLFHPIDGNSNPKSAYRIGDKVKTGQKLALLADEPAYVIASVTGSISAISPYTGDFGKMYRAITIDIDDQEELENPFDNQAASLANAIEHLSFLPGNPPFSTFAEPETNIHTIVIAGVDTDLLISTNQYIVNSALDDLKKGIGILRDISGVDRIILVTAGESMQGYGHIGAEVKNLDTGYPAALPQMIMKNILGEEVPVGQNCEDLGVCFISAEAVASMGKAYVDGRIPVHKILTLVTKDGTRRLIKTTIGTPIRDILDKYDVSINEEDRIIFGGPMRGSAVYSLDHPILPDTDGIVILDRADAAYASDYPCINCGDCVRACPAQIQVHMLVRFLEAGQYEEAADNYDLLSCIECGLCSFVCVSRIPIFQYIKLAKYELDRAKASEEAEATEATDA
ncbi:MAG: 4Fe-4S dicluster domain-containing protein [Deltaproteobacteria bacterium]|nr:4Fe-4S dicluster domain-containing protein [Deltaproteobacteria bacterium]